MQKYTSGVLSFSEQDLPPGQREKLMARLRAGSDARTSIKDQYSVLWAETPGQGAAGAEFPYPGHVELPDWQTAPAGATTAPTVRASHAWQTIVNGRLGLNDPYAPENRRELITSSALPEAKQEAAQSITRGLLSLSLIRGAENPPGSSLRRWKAGFEVVRMTKNSISIAGPDGAKHPTQGSHL
ncbi:hypothetical protein [Pantoea stewartii]|uniref:hypothetical protein n=1 Tax=Pantoea stewartii TaxID=66269 RepID=UPI0025A2B4A1|nr:hypothetical protein [Pantoea stewartii]